MTSSFQRIALIAALIFGVDPSSMLHRVEAAARESGIPLDLSKQPRTYSTIAARTLLRHAERKGTQRALHEALFTAYFLDGRNIADPAVLSDVAARRFCTGRGKASRRR